MQKIFYLSFRNPLWWSVLVATVYFFFIVLTGTDIVSYSHALLVSLVYLDPVLVFMGKPLIVFSVLMCAVGIVVYIVRRQDKAWALFGMQLILSGSILFGVLLWSGHQYTAMMQPVLH